MRWRSATGTPGSVATSTVPGWSERPSRAARLPGRPVAAWNPVSREHQLPELGAASTEQAGAGQEVVAHIIPVLRRDDYRRFVASTGAEVRRHDRVGPPTHRRGRRSPRTRVARKLPTS